MFQPGQKVVCIDDNWTFVLASIACPKKNSIYTVTEVMFNDIVQMPYIMVREIDTKRVETFLGLANIFWLATHFRLLEDKKTDISIFEAMLNPARVPEKV